MESSETWGSTHSGILGQRPAAYFSAEFGIHESLPIYSGGLGVLAGDHLKSASDLGIPLVGVGLFYVEGYFSQRIDENGWQQESYTEIETAKLPIRRPSARTGSRSSSRSPRGAERFSPASGGSTWDGFALFLLDADIPQNKDEDRHLTARLYGGDQRTRIRQEIILGIGGARA